MPFRRSELRQMDLVRGEPLVCLHCNAYMVFDEKLKNGKGKKGSSYRRRRFTCKECGHNEIIHADGARDVEPFRIESKKIDEHVKNEKKIRKKIS